MRRSRKRVLSTKVPAVNAMRLNKEDLLSETLWQNFLSQDSYQATEAAPYLVNLLFHGVWSEGP